MRGTALRTGPLAYAAIPDGYTAHIAMQEAEEHGDAVTWFDHVISETYGG